jgi:hypothetical protein
MIDTINGYAIIARVLLDASCLSDNHLEVILVDKYMGLAVPPGEEPAHRYVIATHNTGDTTWNNGTYFNADSRGEAWLRFARRVSIELGCAVSYDE